MTNLGTVEAIKCYLFSQSSAAENVGLNTDEQSKHNVEEHRPVEALNDRHYTVGNFQ